MLSIRALMRVVPTHKTRSLTSCFLLISLCLCLGCSTGGESLDRLEEMQMEAAKSAEYRVKNGDVLLIKVWGEPKLSGEVLVREDGKFTLDLIGDVPAEGKTLETITKDVKKQLAVYIPAVSLTASVARPAPIRYFLNGKFQKPGEFRSEKKVTLLQAIAKAGGFAPFADESRLTLIRTVAGEELRFYLDYNQVVEGTSPNPMLRDGDFISVR